MNGNMNNKMNNKMDSRMDSKTDSKIDWRKKLASRKLWAAAAGFIAGLVVALGGGEDSAETVSGCIMSGAAVTAYILGEGFADGSGAAAPKENREEE